MPRDLFGDVVEKRISVGTRKWYTVPLSLAAHVAAIIPIVLVPLLATDALPALRDINAFVVAGPTPPEPPPPPRRVEPVTPRPNPNAAPTEAPTAITQEPPTASFELPETPTVGVVGGIPNGVIESELPPVPPPPAPPPQKPVRPGGDIKIPVRVAYIAPVYPPIAMQARIEGTVIIDATIDTEGRIQNLRILRSFPLLDQAALDAVRQWQYTPTLLNGVPVPVVMTVTVTFRLNK